MSDSMVTSSKLNRFDVFLKESEAYSHFDLLERYVEEGKHLGHLPVQPLYTLFRDLPIEKIAEYLPNLTKEQRKTFLNLDLWYKDDLDVNNFSRWLQAYSLTADPRVKKEFITSSEFALFLKARLNIWTFDDEDPHYPDHDYYFLTDDHLLLFEYDKDFEQLDELKDLINNLYAELGVEKAYQHLFKIVSDSFSEFQEDEYRLKKEWLRDYGFVDYYEALELDSPFPNFDLLNAFIARKAKYQGEIDNEGAQQTLHRSALVAYKSDMEDLIGEIEKVTNDNHLKFLNFNFLRLVNGTLTLTDAIREGSTAMTRTGKNTRSRLKLGLSYLKYLLDEKKITINIEANESLLQLFDFHDLYKIGNSLIRIVQRDLKRELQKYFPETGAEDFLGAYWTDFLDNSFDWPVKHAERVDSSKEISSYTIWFAWKTKSNQLLSLLPFAQKFHEMFNEIKEEGVILSEFYLNYTLEDIDFEAILLSSFANFSMNLFNKTNSSKMGLTIDEFRLFIEWLIDNDGKIKSDPAIKEKIQNFQTTFGLDDVHSFEEYMLGLLRSHLEGYEYHGLTFEDFKHVGGPILLTKLNH